LFAGLDGGKDLTYNKSQEVGRWEGIYYLFIDVDKMIGAAGLCVERYCEMRCKKDALQERCIVRYNIRGTTDVETQHQGFYTRNSDDEVNAAG